MLHHHGAFLLFLSLWSSRGCLCILPLTYPSTYPPTYIPTYQSHLSLAPSALLYRSFPHSISMVAAELSCALQWVCLSWLKLSVSSMGQPRPFLRYCPAAPKLLKPAHLRPNSCLHKVQCYIPTHSFTFCVLLKNLYLS